MLHPPPASIARLFAEAERPFGIGTALEGHAVFLTGATGYIGGLVLEQLLRCVPSIKQVTTSK